MAHGKSTDNCSRILCLLQQNRKGITVEKIADKVGLDKSTVYRHLEHLSNMGKATYKEGIAHAVTEKEAPLPGSPERYFQYRGTPEGGGNRFFKAMFGEPEKEKK